MVVSDAPTKALKPLPALKAADLPALWRMDYRDLMLEFAALDLSPRAGRALAVALVAAALKHDRAPKPYMRAEAILDRGTDLIEEMEAIYGMEAIYEAGTQIMEELNAANGVPAAVDVEVAAKNSAVGGA